MIISPSWDEEEYRKAQMEILNFRRRNESLSTIPEQEDEEAVSPRRCLSLSKREASSCLVSLVATASAMESNAISSAVTSTPMERNDDPWCPDEDWGFFSLEAEATPIHNKELSCYQSSKTSRFAKHRRPHHKPR